MISARMKAFSGVDLARLEHHRAAGGQRRRDLRGDLVQRVVPGRDRADDADRLAHDQRVADLLLPRDLARRAAAIEREGHRRQAGLDHRATARSACPSSCGDQRGDLLAALAERRRRSRRRQLGALVGAASATSRRTPRARPRPRGRRPPACRAGSRPIDLLGGGVDHLDRRRRRRARPTRRRCRAGRGRPVGSWLTWPCVVASMSCSSVRRRSRVGGRRAAPAPRRSPRRCGGRAP